MPKMEFTHDEMMVVIQGLRFVNGMDQRGKPFDPPVEDQITASALLIRIDKETG